ncbi:phosphoglycerate kinase [Desulfobotulus alkaliphilus]|uniref:Phosphoglycerate kinase n=1 Tax=Desulfobotulus alkaliphilus TaxID=622671 RepID=A0A562RRA5_9BACT|nr:phosphoglycerate kinase [Desulfobotulus alkaliphilus]TWI71599.1 phosphoglycerate kinase [Desulfobotulus alkaliphilus]
MKGIVDLPLAGKRVLIRVDFNVPMDRNGNIAEDTRIRRGMESIRFAADSGARVIVASHLGRPRGQIVPGLSLKPAADHLAALLDRPVRMIGDSIGPDVKKAVEGLAAGDILMLENLRFYPEEQANDEDFARQLADLCDVYINNAFAVSHRKHASVHAICTFVKEKAAGHLLMDELRYFDSAMGAPARPLVAIVGGAKISSKLKALENLLHRVDKVLIGGAMANTFLKASGLFVGDSLVEDEMLQTAEAVMAEARKRGVRFYLPVDAVVTKEIAEDAVGMVVPVQEIPEGWKVADCGPATVRLYAAALANAKTVVWNGPMGVFEMEPFSGGTMGLARHVAACHGLTIVGGGDTDTAIHKAGVASAMGYISTGGGAFLKLLEGESLPAVDALAS